METTTFLRILSCHLDKSYHFRSLTARYWFKKIPARQILCFNKKESADVILRFQVHFTLYTVQNFSPRISYLTRYLVSCTTVHISCPLTSIFYPISSTSYLLPRVPRIFFLVFLPCISYLYIFSHFTTTVSTKNAVALICPVNVDKA
jgi:hypothetical protein